MLMINNNENAEKVVKATKKGLGDGIVEAVSVVAGYGVGKKVAESTKNTAIGVGAGVVTYSGVKSGLNTTRECMAIERMRKEKERLENSNNGENEKKGFLKK